MLNHFLWGAIVVSALAIGLGFLRFWKDTGERLFAFFAVAFWLLGSQWLLLEIFRPPTENRFYFYLLRLLAFLVIIAGILDKNRKKRSPS